MGLEYIYAALLLHEAGKEITADNVKKVLESAGVSVEEAMINALVTALEGVDIEKIKKESVFAPAPAVAAQPAEQKAEEKKEEEKKEQEEEKKQEEALSGLGALFGM